MTKEAKVYMALEKRKNTHILKLKNKIEALADELRGNKPIYLNTEDLDLDSLDLKPGGIVRVNKPAQEWQPIATAPKDGTIIIGFNGEYKKHKIFTAWFDERFKDSWMEFQSSSGNKPTHWMPLPQPPKEQDQ